MPTTISRFTLLALLSFAGTSGAQTQTASPAMPPPPAAAKVTTTTTTTTASDAPRMMDKRAAAAPGETLSTGEGWNSEWSLLFGINNFIGNSSDDGFLVTPNAGTIAANYYLNDVTAVRAGLFFQRRMGAPQTTKIVQTAGGTSITTYNFNPPGFTELDDLVFRGDYLMRLSRSSLSAYVGGGAQLGLAWFRQNYVDNVSTVDQRTEVDDHNFGIDLTVRGIVGAEWRFHPNFALYAEYSVDVSVFNSNVVNDRTTVENTVGGTTSTSQFTEQRTVNTWLQVNTNLAQGASLGLELFF